MGPVTRPASPGAVPLLLPPAGSGAVGTRGMLSMCPLPMLLQFLGPFAAPVPCPCGDTAAAGGDTLPN